MMTKTDKLIFCGVLFSAILVFLTANIAFSTKGQRVAVVEQNGKQVAEYRLETMTEPKTLTINHDPNGFHKIEISKQGVTVLDTDCKEQTCKTTINTPGQTIVCLPYRLIVRIEGRGEVDGVAY